MTSSGKNSNPLESFPYYYTCLGLTTTNVSQEEILNAYRKKAIKYHPELHPGDAKILAEYRKINRAYFVLSDPILKRLYDECNYIPEQFLTGDMVIVDCFDEVFEPDIKEQIILAGFCPLEEAEKMRHCYAILGLGIGCVLGNTIGAVAGSGLGYYLANELYPPKTYMEVWYELKKDPRKSILNKIAVKLID